MKKITSLFLFFVLTSLTFAGADLRLSGSIEPVTIAPQLRLSESEFKSNLRDTDSNLYKVEDFRNGELVISYLMF